MQLISCSAMNSQLKFALIVPTLNPGCRWPQWLRAFATQTVRPVKALIVDSGSTDGQIERSAAYGLEVQVISQNDFNHGKTRQQCVDQLKDACDIAVFLTQDAILANKFALENIIKIFQNGEVAAAFGRQLPHEGAGALAVHARLFNYSQVSDVRSIDSIPKLGFKTCFMSNSFAAYRIKDLISIGGFKSDVILGEDTCAAAKLIMACKKIAYTSDARVFHSHDYTTTQEFKRYFDIGVLHSQQPWLLYDFGGATGEGMRYVKSELQYLLGNAFWLIPSALLRTAVKLVGYRLGRTYQSLPERWLPLLSMHKSFWTNNKTRQ